MFAYLFPYLQEEGYKPTSPATAQYNCIAWAAGDVHAVWWPDPDSVDYWPNDIPRVVTLEAFFKLYESLGYKRCDDGSHQLGFEKVALYALDGLPKHAARQLTDGRWSSKLGKDIDISHTLRGLEGPFYGQVCGFLRRPLKA